MVRKLLICLCLGSTLLVGSPAAAHDHLAPRVSAIVETVVGQSRQEGRVVSSTWVSRSGPFCVMGHGDGAMEFPPAMSTPLAEETVRIRLGKRQRPAHFSLRAHALTHPDWGLPVSSWSRVPTSLVRVKNARGETIAWDAVAKLSSTGDLYLRASAVWPDVEGCGGGQEVLVTFHFRSPA